MTDGTKTRMVGIRADERRIATWTRRAKAAGMSLNKWAGLVLDSAPEVTPAHVEARKR